ncbi:MAG: XdhC family protein [Chloroflexia bacterium]|nr:XdhC family protein [Chloroflexia bacterium]
MSDILLKMKEYYNDPRPSAICIITGNSGSTPGKVGAKMIVYNDGSIDGTVGGGAVEKRIISDALEVIKSNTPQYKEYNLKNDLEMICGGAVCVYIEPILKPAKLYIFGAGHIGKYIAKYAPDMGFEAYLVDWREEIFEDPEKINYTQIRKPYLEAIADINFDCNTYSVVVTPGHAMDEEVLAAVGNKPGAYVGVIGSKRKIETITKKFLEEKKLTQEELDRVDMPIGIKFNAVAPAEIAVSILAKLIDVKNNKAKNEKVCVG